MPSSTAVIPATEFRTRLAALCTRGGGAGLPRKHRDRHILFKSVTLVLEPHVDYSEQAMNGALDAWLSQVGGVIETDRVSLRRELVDAGYLTRDPAGRSYRVAEPNDSEICFDADVAKVDPAEIVGQARQEIEARRRAHQSKPPDR